MTNNIFLVSIANLLKVQGVQLKYIGCIMYTRDNIQQDQEQKK